MRGVWAFMGRTSRRQPVGSEGAEGRVERPGVPKRPS
jgi:hypothetical protein